MYNQQPTTAKLGDFHREKSSRDPVEFKTTIKRRGTVLTCTMPKAFAGRRFEAYYANGQLMIAEASGNDGVACSHNSMYAAIAVCQWGAKKWVPDMPMCRFKTEVRMVDGSFTVRIPDAAVNMSSAAEGAERKQPVYDERHDPQAVPERGTLAQPAKPREQAAKCIEYLNAFAEKNGFTFAVYDNRLALEKVDRIGGMPEN